MGTLGRIFDSTNDGADPGYHNASLGTTGIAIPFPYGAVTACISVSAGCYFGVRDSATLVTFSDDNYGSILNGHPYYVSRAFAAGGSQSYIHLAPWTSTAAVAIVFG
jgi:hypothetical protein